MLRVEILDRLTHKVWEQPVKSIEEGLALIDHYNNEQGDNFFASFVAE